MQVPCILFVTVLPFASSTWSVMLAKTSKPTATSTFSQLDPSAPDIVSCHWLWSLRWPCVPVSAQPAFSCEMPCHTALLHMPGQSRSASSPGHTGVPWSTQPRRKQPACPAAASPGLDRVVGCPGAVNGGVTDLSACSLWWVGALTWRFHQSWGYLDEIEKQDWLCFHRCHGGRALLYYPGDGGVQTIGQGSRPRGHGTQRWAWWAESGGIRRGWNMGCEFWLGLRHPGVPCVAVDDSPPLWSFVVWPGSGSPSCWALEGLLGTGHHDSAHLNHWWSRLLQVNSPRCLHPSGPVLRR